MAAETLDFVTALVELRQSFDGAPTYHQLWSAVTAGRVPAKRVGRSWRINRGDLAKVAEHFDLPKRAA